MYPFNEKDVQLYQNGKLIAEDHQANIREIIEDMFLKNFGFFPLLQEFTENGEYELCIVTDTYEELNEKQLELLDRLGITEDEEETTKNIKRLFNVEFKIVE